MYERDVPDSMLSLFGLTKADMPDETIDVFPDNWNTFLLFDGMSTQWRVGAVGATGLDYNVIPIIAKAVGVKKKELPEAISGLRVMESEALKVMIEDRDNK